MTTVARFAVLVSLLGMAAAGCGTAQADSDPVADHLALFDRLDFEAFNKQDWALFRQIHCPDVVVTSTDGSRLEGIDAHIAASMPIFSFAPDTAILRHPVAAGKGDWTAVTGIMRATFSQPMLMPDGTSIPPTGKTMEGTMATMARWRGNCIAEEQLFIPDSKVQAAQLGLAP